MVEESGSKFIVRHRYHPVQKFMALVLTPLGAMNAIALAYSMTKTPAPPFDWSMAIAAVICLLFGGLALAGWRDHETVIDTASRMIDHTASPLFGSPVHRQVAFAAINKCYLLGTINNASIWFGVKDEESLCLTQEYRSEATRKDMKRIAGAAEGFLKVHAEIPDSMKNWWFKS